MGILDRYEAFEETTEPFTAPGYEEIVEVGTGLLEAEMNNVSAGLEMIYGATVAMEEMLVKIETKHQEGKLTELDIAKGFEVVANIERTIFGNESVTIPGYESVEAGYEGLQDMAKKVLEKLKAAMKGVFNGLKSVLKKLGKIRRWFMGYNKHLDDIVKELEEMTDVKSFKVKTDNIGLNLYFNIYKDLNFKNMEDFVNTNADQLLDGSISEGIRKLYVELMKIKGPKDVSKSFPKNTTVLKMLDKIDCRMLNELKSWKPDLVLAPIGFSNKKVEIIGYKPSENNEKVDYKRAMCSGIVPKVDEITIKREDLIKLVKDSKKLYKVMKEIDDYYSKGVAENWLDGMIDDAAEVMGGLPGAIVKLAKQLKIGAGMQLMINTYFDSLITLYNGIASLPIRYEAIIKKSEKIK